MVPEVSLEDAGAGLAPASTGWFVMSARDARWFHRPGRGDGLPLRGWFHCPPETRHALVRADETARRYNASSPEDTQDGEAAYRRFPQSQPTRYRDGVLPD